MRFFRGQEKSKKEENRSTRNEKGLIWS